MAKLTPEEEQALSKRVKLSYRNLVAFRHFLLMNGKDELKAPKFHYDWSDILLKEKENFAVEGFRESGKGQIVLRAFPLHCLTFPSVERDFIVLVKQNATLAGDKLLEIEQEYLGNPALCSNIVKVIEQSRSVFAVDVKDSNGKIINIRIAAYGKGSAIRGLANIDRRPKIILIDDPQDTDDARSDTVLEHDWDWFVSDVKFLGQVTRIFLIGNNLGEKCIIERVFANPQELGFQTRKVTILDSDGKPTWPEKFPKDMVDKEKEDFRRIGKIDVWMRERMCVATSAETREFDRNDIMRYSALYIDSIVKGCNFFLTVDPASSTEITACYRAICVNAVTTDNRWIIVDFPFGRWKSDEFIDKLFETVIRWMPYQGLQRRLPVGIEKGHFKQVLEPFIYREMQRRNIFFDIKPIEHAKRGSKLERVKMLGPRFKAHTIMLPESSPWLAELENELAGVTKDGFKSLFSDLIDALAMQEQMAHPPLIGRNNTTGQVDEVPRVNPLETRRGGLA